MRKVRFFSRLPQMGFVVVSTLTCLMHSLAFAEFAAATSVAPESTGADLQMLIQKIDKLEKENQSLKSEIEGIRAEVQQIKSASAAAPAPQPAASSDKPVMTASAPIEMYGYIKVDAIGGDHQIGELTLSAPISTKDEGNFNLTAKESRIGFNIKGPAIGEKGSLVGKIEADFWGNTTDATTTPALRFRQAYLDLKYPNWDILAGQTWDFFAPYNPSTLNFGVLWRAGNIGDRHPQIRWTGNMYNLLGGAGKFTQQLGILDSKAAEQVNFGAPLFGSYSALEQKIFGKVTTIGIGGLIGKSDASTTNTDNLTVWGAVLTGKVKLSDVFSIMGEAFQGQDLYAFRGGSPAGVDHDKAVRSQGGWAQLNIKPGDKIQYNIGGGIDDVYTDSLTTGASAVWDYNASGFANVRYDLAKNLQIGLEYQYFMTNYGNQDDSDANRFQASCIYNF